MQIRWGILGVNWIADKVITGILANKNTEVIAAASRTEERTRSFANRYHIPRVYSSCKELCNDPDIDIIYIATPHANHYEHALLCLQSGKHVLCEKPFTVNAKQAEHLFTFANQKGLFIMEAIWTRFLPSVSSLREVIKSGIIGDVVNIHVNVMFRADLTATQNRIINPQLGGGAMLDLGVYAINLIDFCIDHIPSGIHSVAKMGATGVDLHSQTTFNYSNGAIATFATAIDSETNEQNYIYGTRGYLTVDSCIWIKKITVHTYDDNKTQVIEQEYDVNGYEYQAAAIIEALSNGRLETVEAPRSKTLDIMKTMDQIRNIWGLKYPMELLT